MWICFSATDALKGEGLQEGVDWLQGMMRVCVVDCDLLAAYPTVQFIRHFRIKQMHAQELISIEVLWV